MAEEENQIVAERRAKLAALRKQGNAFPNDFRRTHLAADLHAAHEGKTNEELEAAADSRCGRRSHDVQARDGQGELRHAPGLSGRIQLYITRDDVGRSRSTKPSSTGIWATSSARKARCSAPAPASFP